MLKTLLVMYPALQQKFPDPDGDYALYRSYFMWV